MKRAYFLLALLLLTAGVSSVAAAPAKPELVQITVEVDAPVEEVWRAWTTPEGVQSFFAPAASVSPRVGGPYEIYFFPDRPAGLQGSEGATVLAVEEPRRLLFSWNAPETFGPLRNQLTVVEVNFTAVTASRTKVSLTHGGWGDGSEWARVREYFAAAWPSVLRRLKQRFSVSH